MNKKLIEREIKILKFINPDPDNVQQVTHPNILKYYEHFHNNGHLYIVNEFCMVSSYFLTSIICLYFLIKIMNKEW